MRPCPRSRRAARSLRGALAALALVALLPLPTIAHSPTVGASRGQFANIPDQPVPYRWGATNYPAWLTAAAQDSLDTKYRSWNANNSHAPRPVYSPTGGGIVTYSAAKLSPCNPDPNSQWLQCATGWGSPSFRIFVRDLDLAPYSDWRWWDKTGSCIKSNGYTATGCWYVRRAMIHEAGHAIDSFGHDGQSEADTVMRSVSPTTSAYGGGHFVFQRCDQAALQLLWDVADSARPYGDCFDHVAGHGFKGLVTTATTNGTSFAACLGTARTVGGRLAVKIEPLYGRLSNNPLAGRTLWFDRKRRADTSWAFRAESAIAYAADSGTNWTHAFVAPASTGGTWDYKAHFDGEPGLDAFNYATFTITWAATC